MDILRKELEKESVKHLIDTVFDELQIMGSKVFRDPTFVWWWVRVLLVFFVSIVVVYELVTSGHYILQSMVSLNKVNVEIINGGGKSTAICSLKEIKKSCRDIEKSIIVLDYTNIVEAKRILNKFKTSIGNWKCLPNIIFRGKSGCGKTLLSKFIAENCTNIQHAVINGTDLEAQGEKSCLLLGSLAKKINSSRQRTIIIIDNADTLIRKRGPRFDEHRIEQNFVLYTLLEIAKENSPYLSLFINTKENLVDVDPSILDRIDCIFGLQLPTFVQRLEYNIMSFYQLLEYLDSGNFAFKEQRQYLDRVAVLEEDFDFENFDNFDNIKLEKKQQQLLANYVDLVQKENRKKWSGLKKLLPSHNPISILSSNSMGSVSELRNYILETTEEFCSRPLDVLLCLEVITVISENWSYRDMAKLYTNIRSTILSDYNCNLTNSIIMKEAFNCHIDAK